MHLAFLAYAGVQVARVHLPRRIYFFYSVTLDFSPQLLADENRLTHGHVWFGKVNPQVPLRRDGHAGDNDIELIREQCG